MPCGETSSAHDIVPIYARIHAHSAAKIRRQIRSLPSVFSLHAASVFIVLIYRDCV